MFPQLPDRKNVIHSVQYRRQFCAYNSQYAGKYRIQNKPDYCDCKFNDREKMIKIKTIRHRLKPVAYI